MNCNIKLSLLIIFLVSSLYGKDVVKDNGTCQINWTKGYLICKGTSEEGQSQYAATIAAKVIAQRNMLEFVKGVKIDSRTTVRDGILQSDIIKTSIKGVIQGAQVVSQIYEKKLKKAIVKIKISLYQDILKSILNPKVTFSISQKKKSWIDYIVSPFYLYANEHYNINDKPTLEKLLKDFATDRNNKDAVNYLKRIVTKIDNERHTGIIVDATNVSKFNMAMIPKIRRSDGVEIYPKHFLDRKTVITKGGPVTYEIGLEDAINNNRVYNNPIILYASNVYGNRLSDLVLDKKSILILNEIDKNLFKKAKVLILVGDQ